MNGMAQNNETTNSNILSAYAMRVAADQGLSVGEICAAAGVNPADLMDLDNRIPIITHQKLMEEAIRLAGNELFWLQEINPKHLSEGNLTWDYFFNAPDMREAIRRSRLNYQILCDTFYPLLVEYEDGTGLRIGSRNSAIHPSSAQVDWGLTQWYCTLQIFAGPALKLIEIRMMPTTESRTRAYRNFYRVPVKTYQTNDELLFEVGFMDLPNVRTDIDPGLNATLLELLKPALMHLKDTDLFREESYMAVQKQLIFSAPTLKNIASRLNTSPRTLQRRLKERGLTFTGLVDDARCYLAEYFLSRSNLHITDIGLLLGFSDNASLTRSFRKWHGVSPREFRRTHLQAKEALVTLEGRA